MKLIFAIDAITPPLTGIGRYAWELATRYAANQTSFESLHFLRGKSWVDNLPSLLEVDNLAEKPKTPSLRLKTPSMIQAWRLRAKMRGHLFHSPNYFLPDAVDKGIATIHDLSVFRYPETHPVERIKHFERSFASTLSRATHLITDSDAIRHEVSSYFGWDPQRISTVSLGVSPEFRPRTEAELSMSLSEWGLEYGRYALCVSTLEPRKRVDRLIAAYQDLPPKLRETYPLVLAGSKGWLSADLLELISTAERDGWLRYVGFVPEGRLPLLYSGARAFLFPSLYEGFGLPVLEAMSSGIPVLTSNCSSLPEVTDGAAILVDADDRDAFVEAIQRTLLDEAWRQGAVIRGIEVAKRYDWGTCARQTLEVCRRYG